jgi:hypothetical protein
MMTPLAISHHIFDSPRGTEDEATLRMWLRLGDLAMFSERVWKIVNMTSTSTVS